MLIKLLFGLLILLALIVVQLGHLGQCLLGVVGRLVPLEWRQWHNLIDPG